MDVADLVARFSAEGDERVIRALGQVDAGVTRVADNSTRAGRGLGTVFQVAGGFLAAQAVTGIFRLADGLIDAQTRAEQAKISLEVVTGSAEEAAAVFERIQQFAAATPFEMGDLLDATIQLEAFGLKSEDWLTTIGDTASAMSKSVDQVTQAVLDATSGQYERLKELGIQARVEGDKLTFSYMKNGQQITETVDKNNKAVIASTIQGIWNEKYAGAMEKQSKTFGGQMSTLKDNINLAMQSATAGVFQFATRGLGFINDIFADGFVATIRDRFGPGAAEFVGHIATMAQGVIDAFGEGTPVSDIVDRLPESWQPVGDAVFRVADAFGDLWSKLEAGDFAGFFRSLGEEATQAVDGIGRLAGALGVKLLPEIQKLLDNNQWTAIIRIDSLVPAFTSAARGDWDRAFQQLMDADPIRITPKIEIDIQQGIANWIAGLGRGGGGGGGGMGLGEAIRRGIEITLQNTRIGPISFKWIADKLGPDALAVGRAVVEGIAEGVVRQAAQTDWLAQLLTSGEQIIQGFRDGAAQTWAEVDEWLNSRDDAALNAVGDLSATLVDAGAALLQGLWNGAEERWIGFTSWLENIGSEILTYVGDLSGLLFGVGIDIVAGMAAGISAGAGAVSAAVQAIVNAIPPAVRHLLGIDSPSKVMRDLLYAVPQGMALGIEDGQRLVERAIGDVAGVAGLGVPSGSAPGLSAARVAAASGGGGGAYFDLRGAFVGPGAVNELRRYIAETGGTVADRRIAASNLAGARR